MPRKLPWQVKSSSALVSQKRVVTSKDSPQKRQRREKVDSGVGRNGEQRATDAKDLPPPSSSPPPEPPVETLMKEGIDHDDKYRMVEDEFLAVAQRFTMHLHAAEYKRQQKLAKTRNAETISSITRPVAGKMPDHTRRKVEAVARVKSQKAAVEDLLGKKSDHSDDSDSEELPYVGTTLHGLMDSPRKKTASFAKLGIMATTTRAAAGFKKPATSKSEQNTMVYSTQYKKPSKEVFKNEKIESIESSEDYDGLDRPTPVPELTTVSRKSSTNLQGDRVKSKKTLSNSSFSVPAAKSNSLIKGATLTRSSLIDEITYDIEERDPRPFRPENTRRRRPKPAKEQQSTENFSVIPTFL